jgi:hypothetical protein
VNSSRCILGHIGLVVFGLSWGCQSAEGTLGLDDDSGKFSRRRLAQQAQTGICTNTPKLDLKIRQVSSENNRLDYRAQVFNYDIQPVALKDLRIKVWVSDSSTNLVPDKYYGGLVFSGTNTYLFQGTQLVASATKLSAKCSDPQREADWKIVYGNTDTRLLPGNGGKWVDANFGIHKETNWTAFDNKNDDFSQLPTYQNGNTADKTFNSNDPSTIYGDDVHFSLYYKGVLVKEWINGTTIDPLTGEEPSCFRTCLSNGSGYYPKIPGDPLDPTLAAMVDSPGYANVCRAGRCAPMREAGGELEVIAVITTSGTSTSVRSLLTQVIYELPETSRIAGYIRVQDLPLLRADANVVQVECDTYVQPTMDTSRVSSHADQVESVLHMAGEGTIVGLPQGIDWRHHDFQRVDEKSNVLAMWDQTLTKQGNEQSPSDRLGYSDLAYGVMYSNAEVNRAIAAGDDTTLVRSIDSLAGHGTMVASAAVGTGNGSGKRGIAPGADLFIVRSAGDQDTSKTMSYLVAGTKLIFDEAKRLGKPVVVNHSVGTTFGPHNGLDAPVRDMLAVLHSYDRGVIVKSAGNEGDKATHVSGTIGANAQENTTIALTYTDPTKINGLYLLSCFGAGASYSGIRLRADAYQNGNGDLLATGRPIFTEANWGFQHGVDANFDVDVETITDDNAWGKGYFKIAITINSLPPVPSGATSNTVLWTLTVDTQTYTDPVSNTQKQGNGGTYDIWLGESSDTLRHAKFTGMHNGTVNSSSSILSDASSYEFLVVGASDEQTTLIADPSGRGPIPGDTDYVVDLVTSGYDSGPNGGILMASANDPAGPVNHLYTSSQGTSFSAPQVAGAVALMFQKNSMLTRDEISTILHNTADRTGLSGLPDHVYGYGRLDAFAAVQAVPVKPVTVSSGPTTLAGIQPALHDFPDVALDGSGNTILVWSSDLDGDGLHEAYYKKVDRAGNVVIADTLVAPELTSLLRYYVPNVAVNSKGEFVISWTSEEGAPTNPGSQVRGNVYRADGSLIRSTPIEVTPVSSGYNVSSDSVFIDDDHIMFLWGKLIQPAPTPEDPDPDLVRLPPLIRVYEISTDSWTTDAISLGTKPGNRAQAASVDGTTVIVWTQDYDDDFDDDVVMTRYTGLTGPLSATVTPVSEPDVGAMRDQTFGGTVVLNKFGRVAVCWPAIFWGKGGTYAIYMKEFDANNSPLRSWSNITTNRSADISMNDNGDIVLVYMENEALVPSNIVRYVRFNNDGTQTTGDLATRGNNDNYTQWLRINGNGPGDVSIAWSDFTEGSSNSTIQWMRVNF